MNTTSPASGLGRRAGRAVANRLDALVSARGPVFRQLAVSHGFSSAGDALSSVALAGTLFLGVPSSQARDKMAFYLLLTLAPFALLSPLLAAVFTRYPVAYRRGLGASSVLRGIVAVTMAFQLDSPALYPLAFVMLVGSRIYGISRASLVPVALAEASQVVEANARLAKVGVVAGVVAVPLGAGIDALVGGGLVLGLAAILFLVSGLSGQGLPTPKPPDARRGILLTPPAVRFGALATAGVRFINGYLLLLLAFAFRDADAGKSDFAALLGAAGLGYFLGAVIAPYLERVLREEPMVVAALAFEAAASLVGAHSFGLPAAGALAVSAGLAWGVAKLGLDGLIQRQIPDQDRGRVVARTEGLLQLAWVVGALVPVVAKVPYAFGLTSVGVVALGSQVTYVFALMQAAEGAK